MSAISRWRWRAWADVGRMRGAAGHGDESGADLVGPASGRRRGRRRTRRPWGSTPRSRSGRSRWPRCSTSKRCSSRPDAWVQMTDTQPSGSPAASHGDDLAQPGLEHVEHVRADVEHRPPFEAPAVRERPAEERARDEARPPADRLDVRGLGDEAASAGIEAVREHHQRADAGLADGVDDRLRAVDVLAQRLLEQQGLARPRGRATASSGCAAGVTTIATASQASNSASRSSNAGHVQRRAELRRVRRGARPDTGDAGLRSGREDRSGHHAGPRTRADQANCQGLGHEADATLGHV